MNQRINKLQIVGSSLAGVDSRAKLDGTAVYTSDLRLQDVLHAKVLRSPHAHARILSIDTSEAAKVPGVRAIATGRDLDGLDYHYGMFIRDQPVLARDKVRFVGDPVVAIAADSEEAAYAGLEAIVVHYDVLPPLDSTAAALDPAAPALFDPTAHASELGPAPPNSRYMQEPSPNVLFAFDYEKGDVDDWFARADHVFEDAFTFAPLSHFALEPHIAIARVDPDGRVDVWSNNQDPFLLRQDIARIFRLSTEQVCFHTGLVGGGFGSKSYCKIEPIAVLLARKAGRAVRLMLTMAESMLTVCEHGARIVLRTGVSAAGETLVKEATVHLDGGAYADASPSVAMRLGARFNGPYRWKALRSNLKVVRTTSVPAGSFRGFGAVHVAWAGESQIDMIARRLALDPVKLRLANFLRPGEPGAPDELPLDSNLADGLAAVVERIGVKDRVRTPGHGIGFACALKGAGASHMAAARVQIQATGQVLVAGGVAEIGQSTRTIFTQIAAEELQAPPSLIHIQDIATSSTPYDSGTHASSGATVSGLAVQRAAREARDILLQRFCAKCGVKVQDLTFESDAVVAAGRRYDFAAIAEAACEGADVSVESSLQSPSGAFFWMPVWTAAEVEVDAETGVYSVLRLVNAVDPGLAINPQRCVSQVEGGAVQGLGQALFEGLDYEHGVPRNANPLAYLVPRYKHVPAALETLLLEQGGGPGPYGAKGVGETGNLTTAAAIANAIDDAIGVRITDLPITAAKIVEASKAFSRPSP